MGESKHTPPWELGPTGHVIYASEVEAGERTPYRPRMELARLSVDDPEVAAVVVAAPLMLEALRAAEWRGPRAFAHANSGPTCPWCGQPKPPKNHLGNGHANDCAWVAAIKAATGGET